MKNIKFLKSNGEEQTFLKEYDRTLIHIFITSLDKCSENEDYELGDVLINDESRYRFALICKDNINSKLCIPALRVGLLNLNDKISTLTSSDENIKKEVIEDNTISLLISKHQFTSDKEINSFICTMKELFNPDLHRSSKLKDDKQELINVVICDYNKPESITKEK